MGIEVLGNNGNRKDMQKIEEVMSLIRTWVNPREINYDDDLDCLSFNIRDSTGRIIRISIFNIEDVSKDAEMLTLRTTRQSTVFIHNDGSISFMIH